MDFYIPIPPLQCSQFPFVPIPIPRLESDSIPIAFPWIHVGNPTLMVISNTHPYSKSCALFRLCSYPAIAVAAAAVRYFTAARTLTMPRFLDCRQRGLSASTCAKRPRYHPLTTLTSCIDQSSSSCCNRQTSGRASCPAFCLLELGLPHWLVDDSYADTDIVAPPPVYRAEYCDEHVCLTVCYHWYVNQQAPRVQT